jgi:hypothetical protein
VYFRVERVIVEAVQDVENHRRPTRKVNVSVKIQHSTRLSELGRIELRGSSPIYFYVFRSANRGRETGGTRWLQALPTVSNDWKLKFDAAVRQRDIAEELNKSFDD